VPALSLDGSLRSGNAALHATHALQSGYGSSVCWSLDARDVQAARFARKAAAALLGTFTDSKWTISAAELVIGELLSNAARHSDGNVCLEIGYAEGNAEISVHDTSPAFALDIRRPVDDYAENGRGLYIISELARRVNVYPTTGVGKRVVVSLDLPVDDVTKLEPVCSRRWLRHEGGVCLAPRIARYEAEANKHERRNGASDAHHMAPRRYDE